MCYQDTGQFSHRFSIANASSQQYNTIEYNNTINMFLYVYIAFGSKSVFHSRMLRLHSIHRMATSLAPFIIHTTRQFLESIIQYSTSQHIHETKINYAGRPRRFRKTTGNPCFHKFYSSYFLAYFQGNL